MKLFRIVGIITTQSAQKPRYLICRLIARGLTTRNVLWLQDGYDLLLESKDLRLAVSYLEAVEPLHSKWIYSNWNYDVGSEIIEAVFSMSYASFMPEKFLSSFGLDNTYLSRRSPEVN